MPKKPITLVDYFEKNCSKNKFIFEIETKRKKYHKDVLKSSNDIYLNQNFQRGEKLSIILPNSILFIEYFIASIKAGCIFNPIPYFTSVYELKKIFSFIKPSRIITDRKDIFDKFSELYQVTMSNEIKKKTLYDQIKLKNYKKDIVAIYYSSGTTGNPKGVMYSNKNMVSLISSINKCFKFNKNDRHLALLPFGHTASINYNILPSLMAGNDLFISEGFEKIRNIFFKILSDYKITFTEIVPTILIMLNKLKIDIKKTNLSNLKFIGCGSSTLPLAAQKEFINNYGIKVTNLYGLSETGPSHIDNAEVQDWQPGSIGIPLDVNRCRLNKKGEINLKGDNVFVGYYKNKKLYKKVVKNGWFNTGDLAYFKDNKYWFLDRSKDLIIKGGINIVPMEIEEVIYRIKGIIECCVVGKEEQLQGEEVAVVIKKEKKINKGLIIKNIKNYCKMNLSSYKIPMFFYFWNEIPKTASKKIKRKEVREIINKI